MSQKAADYIAKLCEKDRFRQRYEANQAAFEIELRQKRAAKTLTRGGFLIPKPHILREGLEELRDTGHAYADRIQKMLRKLK